LALTPGARLGVYDILTQIGAGGMGEVYRARDTSLGREVALKLLPRDVSTDPERLRRLDREARLLASLNHPGIATLHGLEEYEGQRFLIMELVPGQTLAERLSHGGLPIREALDVCRQIAEGLEAAHDAGIIHRDLKPANIKVAPDGRVKLLDFGLAKALETAPSGIESTLPAQDVTREGTILGTPSYMSPEQARGQAVDWRTDIWAFGCCLYESLTGRRAFRGNTVTDTLAAVLDRDPDWTELSDDVPPTVGRLLRRCLAKDVRQRVQHMGDARLELEDVETVAHERPMRTRRPLRTLAVVAGASVLVATPAGLVSMLDGRRTGAPADRPVARLTLKLDGGTPNDLSLLVNRFFTPFALSPDGERLVFRARDAKRSQLWRRELAGFETMALLGTENATTPFFSPDGQWVGFWRAEDRILRKVSIAGGTPIEVGPTDVPQSALWGPNNEILFETASSEGELWSIPADGGNAQPIPIRDRSKGERISLRALIPGGKDLLVASRGPGGTWLEGPLTVTGRRHRILRGGTDGPARYTPPGHLVYGEGDTLFAAPLNQQFEAVGPGIPVLHGIDHVFGHSNVAISANGTLVYLPAERIRERELAWLDREGHITPVAGGQAPCATVALSPDARQAACVLVDGTKEQIWILDLERGSKRLLDSAARSSDPIWSVTAHSSHTSAKGPRASIGSVRTEPATKSSSCRGQPIGSDRRTGLPTADRSSSPSTNQVVAIRMSGSIPVARPDLCSRVASARRLRGFLLTAVSSPLRRTTAV
jgi:hypothetical protein